MAATKRAAFYWMPLYENRIGALWYERDKRARAGWPTFRSFIVTISDLSVGPSALLLSSQVAVVGATVYLLPLQSHCAKRVCERVSMDECEAEAFEAFKIKFGSNALFIILQRVSCIRRVLLIKSIPDKKSGGVY